MRTLKGFDTRLVLVTGGARSGKSAFAEAMAQHLGGAMVTCIVTLDTSRNDDEMAARIALHQSRRPSGWQTIEAPHDPAAALCDVAPDRVVLIDCLTVWLANRLETEPDASPEHVAASGMHDVIDAALGRGAPTIVVSNEVGAGLVPLTALGRRFRDAVGRANALMGQAADQVWLVAAGQPLRLKPDENAPSWWTGRNIS